MRVILALAALPLVVFALAPRVPVRASAPLAPTPVVSEGVGVIPLDARSFDARWWPDVLTTVRVRTVPVRLLTNEKPVKPVVKPAATRINIKKPTRSTILPSVLATCSTGFVSAPGIASWIW